MFSLRWIRNENVLGKLNKGGKGRISLNIDGGVANVDIVETAPHNYGHNGKYEGVGGHLFAIACKVSMESGCFS